MGAIQAIQKNPHLKIEAIQSIQKKLHLKIEAIQLIQKNSHLRMGLFKNGIALFYK